VLFLAILGLVDGAAAPSFAVAVQDRQHRVIALHAARPEMPAFTAIDAEIQRVLSSSFGSGVDSYAEYVDVVRFADPHYVVALRDFLGQKYANTEVDEVVATSASIFGLVVDNRALLFSDAASSQSLVLPCSVGPSE
jgi:hypothetical protein